MNLKLKKISVVRKIYGRYLSAIQDDAELIDTVLLRLVSKDCAPFCIFSTDSLLPECQIILRERNPCYIVLSYIMSHKT